MIFVIEPPIQHLQEARNLRVVEKMIQAYEPCGISGYAVLSRTAFLQHCRWSFHGTGAEADALLHGPTFHPALLDLPDLAPRLCEVTEEFLMQVQTLCETREQPPLEPSAASKIIHVDFTVPHSAEKRVP